ncbi:MAG: tetratricopeptide repeat protein [Bryobacteraceae bacterium]
MVPAVLGAAGVGTLVLAFAVIQAATLIGASTMSASMRESYSTDTMRMAVAVGDAGLLERWAELAREQSQTNDAHQALVFASRLNPRSAKAWSGLGFEAEHSGQLALAREYFEKAFAVDRQYQPAWTLANFCFRQSDAGCFWRAAKRAAQVAAPGMALSELSALLRLADAAASSPEDALGRLDGGARIERTYLDHLIGARRLTDALVVAHRLAQSQRPEDQARLDDFVNRLMEANRVNGAPKITAAVGIWNASGRYAPLDPEHGLSLTNGDFASEPRNTGFDWHLPLASGLSGLWTPGEIFLQASEQAFRAGQPAAFDLLSQTLPLEAGKYRLRAEYLAESSSAVRHPPELRWELDAAASTPLVSGAGWREAQFEFRAPSSALYLLRLRCQRELTASPLPITTAISIRLRRIRLEVA